MPYRLTKTFRFEAAHHLPDHDGVCARPHWHSWVVHVSVSGDAIADSGPKAGMLMDYAELSAIVRPLIDVLDHSDLNEVFENPTSEILACFLFRRISLLIPHGHGHVDAGAWPWRKLDAVRIEETCTAACEYLE